jgi:excinuclease ABC subunit C
MNIVYSKDEIHNLPDQPGIYRFYNAKNSIIYVGKAKSIIKRVKSYFVQGGQNLNIKTSKMVKQIKAIDCIIVNSEYEALLLENNLIKHYQPIYNILLKDDKSYPYICITNERFPRIISARQIDKSLGTYYGPFISTNVMFKMIDTLNKLYKIRTCKYNLSEENLKKKKFKVCLEYHLGNCKGPCESLQKETDYSENIENIKHILKGNINELKQKLKHDMLESAKQLNFEKAQSIKEEITALETYHNRSVIINTTQNDIDVFAIIGDESIAYVNYIKVNQGVIILSQTIELQKKLDEEMPEILAFSILYFREKYTSKSSEIIANIEATKAFEGSSIKVTVPKQGDKRKLVELALKNGLFTKQEKLATTLKQQNNQDNLLTTLKSDLNLEQLPRQIECFDNSNIQGKWPVASMVCFINGKPSKNNYRHYDIKTVSKPDDYASMYEVVFRRYNHLKATNNTLPNLIVIDGGKGQLNAAIAALKNLDLYSKIDIVSIAKKLEIIHKPNELYPIYLNKRSPSLKLIQRIRDEAHRFAITFHKNKRSKGTLSSALDSIKGIGPTTIKKLTSHFKTIDYIKKASMEELCQIVDLRKAKLLKDFFEKEEILESEKLEAIE